MALTWEEQCVYEQIFLSAYSSPPPPSLQVFMGGTAGDGSQRVMSELYGTLVLPDGLNQFGKP